jgi:isopentenyl diphosphate isomerase/L-lactate dehydrogenase-like FMN-dependent dehydrogenase
MLPSKAPAQDSSHRITTLAALERAARVEMSGYRLAVLGGTDAEWTLRRNTAAFRAVTLVDRRREVVAAVAPRCHLLGQDLELPVLIGPAPFGDRPGDPLRVHSAVRAAGTAMVVQASLPFKKVVASRDQVAFRQVYFRGHGPTEREIGLAVDNGARGIFLTVDVRASPVHESFTRRQILHTPEPLVEALKCHVRPWRRVEMTPSDVNDISGFAWRHPEMSWADVARVRRYTSVPLILKGVLTREDALLALDHGADGVVVSNHGGRGQDRTPAAIEVLSEVVAAASGRMTVLVDGGIRSGLDTFKALALGADAVLVVRPIYWALAIQGDAGPGHVLDILRREFEDVMRAQGCASLSAVNRGHVHFEAA